MRLLFALFLVIAATPALAEDWGRYSNARFGYRLDVPPGFTLAQDPENGDGVVMSAPDGRAQLRVFGGFVTEGDFEDEVNADMSYAEDDGWRLTYKRSTPRWASYSGKRNGQIVYARAIPLCDGDAYATFVLIYPQNQLRDYDAVVERLVGSLRPISGGTC